jgi:hypothetical protein
MKSVLPVACHSHNDYWRQRPLFSALGSGCVSVEADVWLMSNELYVGHSEHELTKERTFQRLYVDPLVEILEGMNPIVHTAGAQSRKGVFYQDPSQTLVLLIDFKSPNLWSYVVEQLAPLRERGFLTFWNGQMRIQRPVTVVASGSAPFDLLSKNETYRDIFYDAPLAALQDRSQDSDASTWSRPGNLKRKVPRSNPYKYNPSNSYYASSSLTEAVGPLFGFAITQPQVELIQKQVHRAREQGLIPRYWGTPRWPRGLRNTIWGVLLRQHVGVLNVDDLRAMRKGLWKV